MRRASSCVRNGVSGVGFSEIGFDDAFDWGRLDSEDNGIELNVRGESSSVMWESAGASGLTGE